MDVPGGERPSYTVRAMTGAELDFVIMAIYRKVGCAIASHRLALAEHRRHFTRSEHHAGEQLICSVAMVWSNAALLSATDLMFTSHNLI